jgi:hypothetical protein
MAYKFQLGAAIMSGSLQQEGNFTVRDDEEDRKFLITNNGVLSSSNQAHIVGGVSLGNSLVSSGSMTSKAAITAGTSFIIGAADLDETDMEKLDGITNGTAAANKAVVLDGSKDLSGLNDLNARSVTGSADAAFANVHASTAAYLTSVTGSGALTMGALAGTSLALQSGGITAAGSIAGASTIDASGDLTVGSITNANFTVSGGGAVVASSTISGAAGSFAALGGTSLALQSGGITAAGSIAGASSIDGSGDLTMGTITMTGFSVDADGDVGVKTLDVNSGGITEAGAIAGASSIDGSGDLTMGTITMPGFSVSAVGSGSLNQLTVGPLSASGSVSLAGVADVAAVVSADSFYFLDVTDNLVKSESMADYASSIAGAGIGASSGGLLLAAAADGGLQINADSLQFDLNDLAAASIDVGSDSFAILDATDASSKKESIAALATAMAGTGLTATNGVFSVAAAAGVAARGDASVTLTEAFNYASATMTADRVWSLPASAGMSAGDTVYVKAAVLNGNKIAVTPVGSQTIEGAAVAVSLESDYAAVSLKYVAADTWMIF